MELADPASRRQSQQKEDLPSELTKRTRGDRLKGRATEKGKNPGQIPRRNPRRVERVLQAERAKKVPKNEMRGKLRKNETENNTQHGAVRSNGGERETRDGEDTEERTQSSGPKDEKQSAHDDDTRHGIQTTSPGNSPRWKLFGSGQANEPLPKRI